MKKILLIIILLSSVFLTGCFNSGFLCELNPDADACVFEYEPLTGDTTGLVKNWELLDVIDMSSDFDFTVTSMNTFTYDENQDIPYVDAEEFLYLIHEGLVYFQVNSEDNLEISYKIADGSIFNRYEYKLVIDTDNNTVYFNDMGFLGDFNNYANIAYDTDLQMIDSTYSEGVLENTIYLDDYDIQMVKEDDRFFMPLYLANLFLTGDYLNVYKSEQNLYIIDDFYSLETDIFNNSNLGFGYDTANLIENSANYLAMFFDNFYGLKEYFGVESYETVLREKGLYDATSIADFDELMQSFVYELDDLHTSVVDYGFNANQVDNVYPADDSKLRDFYDVYQSEACVHRVEEFIFYETDGYYVMEINEFTMDTVSYLADNLVDLDPDKPVYIDLACNPGGSLVAVLEVLMYMTDSPVDLRYANPATGEFFTETYQLAEGRALTNEFFLFTSKMTFSAANLLTSIVQDNELATVFGNHTSGGACAILYNVLPNNLVITYSSLFAMVDKENHLIEAGIAPDLYLNVDNSLTDTLSSVSINLKNSLSYTIDNNSDLQHINLSFTTHSVPNNYTVEQYIIEVKDNSSNTIVYSDTVTSQSFSINECLSSIGASGMTITIKCSFTYQGLKLSYPVYQRTYTG